MRLLVMRHGETDWNLAHKMQGRTDIELNAEGERQAREGRELLKNEKIDVVIHSPLRRAARTAEIVASEHSIMREVDERLTERALGSWEGKRAEDIRDEELDLAWTYGVEVEVDGIESLSDVFSRIEEFLDELRAKYSGKTVLAVTHGGVIKVIEAKLGEISEDACLCGVKTKNCEIRCYELEDRAEE